MRHTSRKLIVIGYCLVTYRNAKKKDGEIPPTWRRIWLTFCELFAVQVCSPDPIRGRYTEYVHFRLG